MHEWQCLLCGEKYLDEAPPKDLICKSCQGKISSTPQQKSSPEKGIKHDQDKLRFDLFSPVALEEVAKVYTFGAKKYGDRNWEKGLKWGRVFGAIQRHLWAFWGGEDKDPETGILHLAHAAWGCLALIHYWYFKRELDNRPSTVNKIEKFQSLKETVNKHLEERITNEKTQMD